MKKLWLKILAWLTRYIPKVIPNNGPPEIKQGQTQVWYGRVNYWATAGKDILEKDLVKCAASGVTGYHIEMSGWADSSGYRGQWGSEDKMKQIEETYEFLVEQCRSLGLWLFVSITNDNAGSKKYGDSGTHLGKVRGDVSRLIECVRKNGKENVIVQPVGETQTGAGREIENEAAKKLKGFTLVYNGGSRPKRKASWAQWNAWHPWTINDNVPSDQIIVSDTGRIISELCHGLDPTGAGKPDHTRQWVKNVRAKGCPVVCFYHFKRKEHDGDIIEVLGDA